MSFKHPAHSSAQVGVLALPYTFSYLTWAGGLIALSLSASISLYTSYLLAALHLDDSGVRHNRYLDLARAVLGESAQQQRNDPVVCTILALTLVWQQSRGRYLNTCSAQD